jgi:hypothetical protein
LSSPSLKRIEARLTSWFEIINRGFLGHRAVLANKYSREISMLSYAERMKFALHRLQCELGSRA